MLFCLAFMPACHNSPESNTTPAIGGDSLIGNYAFADDSQWPGKPLTIFCADLGLMVRLDNHTMPLEKDGAYWKFTTGDRIADRDSPGGYRLEWFLIGIDDSTSKVFFSAPEMLPERLVLDRR